MIYLQAARVSETSKERECSIGFYVDGALPAVGKALPMKHAKPATPAPAGGFPRH